ncbi:MAG: DUF1572 family protein [Bacteroidota bacterium]
MLRDLLKGLMIRDLEKLKQEILAYQNEEKLWSSDRGISNSAGNLCLHLIGNLNTYIGAQLGSTGYLRNREEEFTMENIPREQLVEKVEQTILMIGQTFDMISDQQLNEIYPGETPFNEVTTHYSFVHLAMHLAYHLGQINYHRRFIDN